MNNISEIRKIIKVFLKSPYVLTSKGYSSDPFVLMSQIFDAESDNDVVKLMYKSTKELFRLFGVNAKVYFKFLSFFLDNVQEGTSLQEFKDSLETYIKNASYHYKAPTKEDLLKRYSELAVEAVEEADGGYLSLIPADETSIDSSDAVFEVGTSCTESIDLSDVTIAILPNVEKKTVVDSVAQAYEGKPLVMLFNEEDKFASEFAKANEKAGIYFIRIRPIESKQDFYLDLCSFVNAVPTTKAVNKDTSGHALTLSVKSNRLMLTSKKSIQRSNRIKQITQQIEQEESPLRREVMQRRLSNLVMQKTVVKIAANSDSERKSLIQRTAFEIVEISNCLKTGIVESNSISEEFNGISSACFAYTIIKAAEDLLLFRDSQVLENNEKL